MQTGIDYQVSLRFAVPGEACVSNFFMVFATEKWSSLMAAALYEDFQLQSCEHGESFGSVYLCL